MFNGRPLRIDLALSPHRAYTDTCGAVLDTLAGLGVESRLVQDGDPSVMGADAVILFGRCSRFHAYPQFFSKAAMPRPKTLLWHIEPLAPAGMDERAQRLVRQVAAWHWEYWPPAWRAAYRCVPGHRHIRDLAWSVLARRLGAHLSRLRGLATDPPSGRVLEHAVQDCLWFEKTYSPEWCDHVFVSAPERKAFLTERGIACDLAPLGYHPRWGERLATDRDVDVLFLGRVSRTGRSGTLRRVRNQLRTLGVPLTMVTDHCYGRARTELLNRTRIVLDLSKTPWELAPMRAVMAAACGALLVSNAVSDTDAFPAGHWVQVPTDRLAETLHYYLRHESERREIADRAHRYVTQDRTMERTVGALIRAAGLPCPDASEARVEVLA